MIRLSLVSVGMVEETGNVILILRAVDLQRLLVMQVGVLEGRAIALEAEGVKSPRPLTHDLAHGIITALGAVVEHVLIREYKDQTFFATLVLRQPDGRLVEVDCRPSDAIAVALAADAPVLAAPEVVEAVGLDESAEAAFDDDDDEDDDDQDDDDDEDDDDDDTEDDGGDEEKSIVH